MHVDLFSLGSTSAWQVRDDHGYPDLSYCFSRPLGFRLSFGTHSSPMSVRRAILIFRFEYTLICAGSHIQSSDFFNRLLNAYQDRHRDYRVHHTHLHPPYALPTPTSRGVNTLESSDRRSKRGAQHGCEDPRSSRR